MDEPRAVVPVGVVRERVIQTLSNAFANDLISVAELEDRLERAYRVTTADEALALIAGLPTSTPGGTGMVAQPESMAVSHPRERFLSIFSSQARRGVWAVPRELEAAAFFSDTTIDLTHATLPREMVDIHLNVVFANVKIVVPQGLRVVNKVGAFFANVQSEAALELAPMKPGSPVVRITGHCVFGNLEIVSRFTPDD
jgi:hypothetical protein